MRTYESIEKLIYLHKHLPYTYIAFTRDSNYDFLKVEILLTKPRWFLNPLILDYECTFDEKKKNFFERINEKKIIKVDFYVNKRIL